MVAFSESLAIGQLGESKIARYLISRGNSVVPVYEKEIDTGKGPRFFTPKGQVVAPDMLVLGTSIVWVEAKHKSVFSWHRITRRWVTGIDLNHYEEYQRVARISRRPVWLLFLHRESRPDPRDVALGCPTSCPVGLFAGNLAALVRKENHRHSGWGRHGMVYWAESTLKLIATLPELEESIAA